MTNNGKDPHIPAIIPIIAGGFSGVFTRLICQPLDVIKIRFQLQVEPIRKGDHEAKYRSILQAFRLIVREEGPLSLWKGHVPAQVLSLSYGVFQFGVYEALVQQARSVPMLADDKAKVEFVCGYTAGSMATILSFPFDIVRTRLIVQGNNKMYSGMIHGMRHILRTEGLRGWWRGLTPTLLQVGPLSGVQFATYNFFKRMFGNIAWLGEGKAGSLSVYGSLSAGFLAGLAAKATTYPLDLVRRRIQLQGFQQGRIGFGKNFTCNSLLHCVRETVRGEHLTGLFKGLLPSLLKASIVSALIFSVYEKTHQVLCDIHEKSRQQKKQ